MTLGMGREGTLLRESGLSDSRKLKIPRSGRVYVARHRGNDALAPSERLFKAFKEKSRALGNTVEGHNRAFKLVQYERKFREQVLHNPDALHALEQLSRESKSRDIYLICYEGPQKACHRRILLRICEERFGAKVRIDGIEP